MAELPPWLTRDYDPIGTFMRAYQTGAQIRQEQTRLAEQQRQANMEAQARQQQLEQQALLAAVNNAVEQSYNNQRIQIDQQRLENERKRNADLAKKAVDDLTKPKINFSASGRVLSYDPVTGQVTVIREGEVKPTKQPTISPSMALNVTTDLLRKQLVEDIYGGQGLSNLVNIAKSGFMPPPTGEVKQVTTQAEFDALPSGTIYISTDGKRYRKP